MKKTAILFLLAGAFFVQKSPAQLRINVNIGSQPVWGPIGYDHADYYYMPDYDVYYSVADQRYVYWESNRWMFAPSLPPRFRNIDVYHSYKVVLNGPKPYLHHNDHLRMYAKYKGRRNQPVIRESHDQKYWAIKDHPDHNKWHGDAHNNRHDRNDHRDDHHDDHRGH